MAKYTKSRSGTKTNSGEPLRFAHPFVTTVPVADRTPVPGIGNRMTDYIKTKLEPIPSPKRDPTMQLAEITGSAGVKAIEQSGAISFHAVGDTGNAVSPMPELVAKAMATAYNAATPAQSPAFFLHLGDVIYYDNTDKGYHAQFYTPYKDYPGKIIAIPGNHDGELFKWDGTSSGQVSTLAAFQRNFCQLKTGVPPAAGTIFREMTSQPAVYWVLRAPFIDIIGLYSNVAENPGYIAGAGIGTAQQDWLVKTLTAISKDRVKNGKKALLIAVHHPPIAAAGGHSSSTEMLATIDAACTKSGIMPDLVLAAHAHNYQRFTRNVGFNGKKLQIPFIVCGSGGRGITTVAKATGQLSGDHVFNQSMMQYGYLTIKVSAAMLTAHFYQVDANGHQQLADTVTVNLSANTVK